MQAAPLDVAFHEAIMVASGLRTACLLDASAASASAAALLARAAACSQGVLARSAALTLIDVGAGTFLIGADRLQARLAALRAGSCAGGCDATHCPCGFVCVPLCQAAERSKDAEAAALLSAAEAVAESIDTGLSSTSLVDLDGSLGGEWQPAASRHSSALAGAQCAGITPLRMRVELPKGACPVALTGWLLEYPLLWSTGGEFEASKGALDDVQLLHCSAALQLPVRTDIVAGCESNLHRRLPPSGTIICRISYSAPCSALPDVGSLNLRGDECGGEDLCAHAPPGLRAVLRAWVQRMSACAASLPCNTPPSFSWRIFSSPRVVV